MSIQFLPVVIDIADTIFCRGFAGSHFIKRASDSKRQIMLSVICIIIIVEIVRLYDVSERRMSVKFIQKRPKDRSLWEAAFQQTLG